MIETAPPIIERTTWRRRWTLRTAAVAAALVFCELALQGASRLIPSVDWVLMAPHERARASQIGIMRFDPVTQFRGNPDFPGHDRLGFNNASVPRQVDLVAIGDSMTYGVLGSPDLDHRVPISSSLTWPAFVADLSGLTTYNMGLGGWGPVEYLHVLDDALALNPQTIVLGFYLGNDLDDCYRAIYLRKQYADLADPALADAVARSEAKRSALAVSAGVFPAGSNRSSTDEGGLHVRSGRVRTLLSKRCKLFGFGRSIKNFAVAHLNFGDVEDDWNRALRWAETRRDRYHPFDGGRFRTVVAPGFRHSAIDPTRPRNQAGLHIAFEAIGRCADRCRQEGVDLIVLVLPTKELVFESLVEDLRRFPGYAELVVLEHALRAKIAQTLADQGIDHVDALDALRACFDRGEQPYAVSGDGHPNATGYHAIATVVAEHLRQARFARLD